MQEVALDRLADGFDRLLKEFPQERVKLLEEIGREALGAVRSSIGGAGKVQRWQDIHMGSGGGYVAIRAMADTYQTTAGGKRYAVGAVTNAIESGHNVRRSGMNSQRKTRAVKQTVQGRFFYRDNRRIAETIAQQYAGRFAEAIKKLLEG